MRWVAQGAAEHVVQFSHLALFVGIENEHTFVHRLLPSTEILISGVSVPLVLLLNIQ